jgi:hypothetical protein
VAIYIGVLTPYGLKKSLKFEDVANCCRLPQSNENKVKYEDEIRY